MAEWTIRRATMADEPVINDLYNQMLEALFGPDDEENVLSMTGVWEDPDVAVFAAEMDGRMVGMLHTEVHRLSEEEAYLFLADLSVDRAYRNRGVGTALLRQAEERAASLGLTRLRLDAMFPHARAIALYRRMGYRDQFPGEGSWMIKDLA